MNKYQPKIGRFWPLTLDDYTLWSRQKMQVIDWINLKTISRLPMHIFPFSQNVEESGLLNLRFSFREILRRQMTKRYSAVFIRTIAERLSKTAGYHRHIFSAPILSNMAFKKIKAFNFSSKNFLIALQKKSHEFAQTLERNNIIWHAFYCIFVTFTNFEKKSFSVKNKSIINISSIFERSYNFSRILQQIFYNLLRKKFHIQNRPEIRIR